MNFFRLLLTCSLLTYSLLGNAQTWRPYTQPNSAEILHRLQKLNVLGSALYIAAHPDDENTRLLAWLANEKKVRTGYLSLTRGDGGQNLIGPEQGEALGIIRTQELLAARRIDGAEQFFTRAYDFGYSKTPEETFRIWNRDSVLADVVWVIRQFRPDVIITRFPTTGEGGHGHHTASAMLAVEAFDAAADPKRFPEQLKYVSVWGPRRLFWNTFNFGGNNTTREDQLQLDVGGYNPLLGKSYGEIAAEARTMHKSQGFGSAAQRGSSIEYFKLLKGDSVKKDLFEGIDLTWGRVGLPEIGVRIEEAVEMFSATQPEKSLPRLIKLYGDLFGSGDPEQKGMLMRLQPEQQNAMARIESEIEALKFACAGIFAEETAAHPSAVIGGADTFRTFVAGPDSTMRVVKVDVREIIPMGYLQRSNKFFAEQARKRIYTDTISGVIPRTRNTTDPYWLQRPIREGRFTGVPQLQIGKPESEPISTEFLVHVGGGILVSSVSPIVYKTTDPVKGEIYRPFEILPPVTANFSGKAFVFEGVEAKTVSVQVQSHGDSARGRLELQAPAGWKVSIPKPDFHLRGRGAVTTIGATVTPSAAATEGELKASLIVDGERYSRGIRRIEYDHIPAQAYLPPAEARLVPVALKTGGKNIGYIVGAGDEVPAALRGVGYTVTELDEAAVMSTYLWKYDAIVTGVRAYNTNEWMQTAYDTLMSYVRGGGNLVVQYNTANRISTIKARMAPDSFTITRDRITDEESAVTFLAPEHPALNVPNKISPKDFEGWIQERSIYHASNWASSFTPILSMADPGEKANNGALIVQKYGKGNFVYTGLVFFRELPAGVPGAYRLFANLLALPPNK